MGERVAPSSIDGERVSSSDRERRRLYRRNLRAVSWTSFLTDLSSEMVLHLIPLFMVGGLGVGFHVVGFVEGVAGTVTSGLRWLSGRWSDRQARRKPFAVAGYFVSSCGKALLPFAAAWTGLAAARWTDRVGKGLRTAPRDALLADSTPADRRGLAFGFHRSADTLGAVLGIGGAMWLLERSGGVLDGRAFRIVATVALVPAFLAVAVLAAVAREPRRDAEDGLRGAAAESKAASTPDNGTARTDRAPWDRPFVLLLVAVAIFDLSDASEAFLLLRAADRGLGVATILGMLLAMNVVYAAISWPAGRLSDRWGRRGFLVVGWTLHAVVYGMLGFDPSTVGIGVAFVLQGVQLGLTHGALKALVVDLVPTARRGEAFGLLAGLLAFLDLPASLLAGVLWQGFGANVPFRVGAALAMVAVVVLLATSGTSRPYRRSRPDMARSL